MQKIDQLIKGYWDDQIPSYQDCRLKITTGEIEKNQSPYHVLEEFVN